MLGPITFVRQTRFCKAYSKRGVPLKEPRPQGCVGLPSMEDGYDGEVQPSAER